MKRLMMFVLALSLCLAVSASALAESSPDSTVTVTGTANVSLASDTASIQIGAMTRALTVSQAQEENDGIMRGVQAALKALGIDDKDVVTNSYYVNAEVPYMEPGSIRRADTTYSVTNMLNVTIRDLSLLSQAIDEAAKAGANQIYSMEFTSSKAPEAYHRALGRAVEDGRAKAETLALAAGKTLGDIQSITAVDYYAAPYGLMNAMDMKTEGMSSGIVAGDVKVSASLTLVFTLK